MVVLEMLGERKKNKIKNCLTKKKDYSIHLEVR
jgi:hypothetical protein